MVSLLDSLGVADASKGLVPGGWGSGRCGRILPASLGHVWHKCSDCLRLRKTLCVADMCFSWAIVQVAHCV